MGLQGYVGLEDKVGLRLLTGPRVSQSLSASIKAELNGISSRLQCVLGFNGEQHSDYMKVWNWIRLWNCPTVGVGASQCLTECFWCRAKKQTKTSNISFFFFPHKITSVQNWCQVYTQARTHRLSGASPSSIEGLWFLRATHSPCSDSFHDHHSLQLFFQRGKRNHPQQPHMSGSAEPTSAAAITHSSSNSFCTSPLQSQITPLAVAVYKGCCGLSSGRDTEG